MSTATETEAVCPKCGGAMWDNRVGKKNPKAPDYKCRDRSCDGVIWPPRGKPQPPSNQKQPIDMGRTGIAELDEQVDDESAFVDRINANQTASDKASERLHRIFQLQEVCFTHALKLAAKAESAGIKPTLEGISALTAQALIAAKEGR